MAVNLDKLEGRKFCVVFVKVVDAATGKVKLMFLRGRASVDRGRVTCIREDGVQFTLPAISVNNIMPSDGTSHLRDAEYFCMVRLDDAMELVPNRDIPDEDECDYDCDCGCGHDHHHE